MKPNLYPVPYGLDVSVAFVQEGDSIHVDIHAPLYKTKLQRLTWSYGAGHYTPATILRDRDFISKMVGMYGSSYRPTQE